MGGLTLLPVAVQNNLDSIQGKQGLQLLGLPQVMDLCTGTVIAGASRSFLFPNSAAGSFTPASVAA